MAGNKNGSRDTLILVFVIVVVGLLAVGRMRRKNVKAVVPQTSRATVASAPVSLPEPLAPKEEPLPLEEDAQLNSFLSTPAPTPQSEAWEKLPPSLRDGMLQAKRRREAAFASIEGARQELKLLKECVGSRAALPVSHLPKDFRVKAEQVALFAKSACITEAEQLAEKFPALKTEVQREIVAKAPPRVLEMARQPRTRPL